MYHSKIYSMKAARSYRSSHVSSWSVETPPMSIPPTVISFHQLTQYLPASIKKPAIAPLSLELFSLLITSHRIVIWYLHSGFLVCDWINNKLFTVAS